MGALLSIVSSWVLTLTTRMKLFRSGLKEKCVDIRVRPADPSVRAHYLERAPTGRVGARDRRDLIIVPGFTAHADTIMSDLVWALKPIPPGWRIVVMELPLHAKNIQNFDGEFPDFEGIFHYLRAFVEALEMGGSARDGIPLSLCGYSLGGNACLRYLHRHPDDLDRIILLAPAFPETFDRDFLATGRRDPRRIHAWQTLDEARSFVATVAGCHPGHLLGYDALLAGLVRQRRQVYGKHVNFFADYFAATDVHREGSQTREEERDDPLAPAALARVRRPVLCVTGDRDACVRSDECRARIAEAIGEERCTFRELPDTGHYGGPSDGPPDSNIFYAAAPLCAEFLFGK